MDDKQKWLEAFKAANGRQPSPGEFLAAKENNFDRSAFETESANEQVEPEAKESKESTSSGETPQPLEETKASENEEALPKSLQARWASFFEEVNGRKPLPEEFLAAKAQSFDMADLEKQAAEKIAATEPEKTQQEKWLEGFEQKYGRKPNPQEFAAAKISNFSLLTLEDVAPSSESAAPPLEATNPMTAAAPAETESTPEKRKKKEKKKDESSKSGFFAKHKKLKIGGIIAAAVILISLIGGFIFANNYFSYSSQLQRYVTTYNNDKGNISKDLSDYVWADNKKALKKMDLDYLTSTPQAISTASILPGTTLVKDGTQFLIFPKYKVAVTPQTLNIKANAQGLSFSINGMTVGSSTSDSYNSSISRLFPSTYTVKADGTVNNQTVNLQTNADLTNGASTANFDLQFISFHLYSNINNGDVYAGTSKIGTLNGGDYKFVNVPVLAGEILHVQQNFSDGVIKSQTMPIAQVTDGQSIYLNWGQEMTMNAANNLLQSAVSDISSYAEDKQDASNISDTFSGGVSNSWYSHFRDMVDSPTDKGVNGGAKADSVSVGSPSVTSITQTGVNSYTLTVTLVINYDFYGNNTANLDGTDQVTAQYNINVQYQPGSQASQENSNFTSQNSTTDSSTSGGSGDDASNFKITGWDPNSLTDVSDNNQVQSNNNSN
jgi:chemotaxis protein histidine kinase CheA